MHVDPPDMCGDWLKAAHDADRPDLALRTCELATRRGSVVFLVVRRRSPREPIKQAKSTWLTLAEQLAAARVSTTVSWAKDTGATPPVPVRPVRRQPGRTTASAA